MRSGRNTRYRLIARDAAIRRRDVLQNDKDQNSEQIISVFFQFGLPLIDRLDKIVYIC